MVVGPRRPRTKNDCAGEGQQQFTQNQNQELKPELSSTKTLGRIPVVGGPNQAVADWMVLNVAMLQVLRPPVGPLCARVFTIALQKSLDNP
jgi:hypothetical protein